MNKRQVYNGQIYKNSHGYEFEVIDYKDAKHVTVQFCDETKYTVEVTSSDILRGKVKHLYGKTVHGIGYFGVGPYKSEDYDGKMTKQYSCWIGMLDRCYKRTSLAYEDKFVNPLWHCFQNFAEWCKDRKGFDNLGWELDKDLVKLGNKEYGPDTCAFVPQEINVLVSATSKINRGQYPVGTYFHKKSNKFMARCAGEYLGIFTTIDQAFHAYKNAKEIRIKEVANKYKDSLDERVYNTLMTYQVTEDI